MLILFLRMCAFVCNSRASNNRLMRALRERDKKQRRARYYRNERKRALARYV